jgi:hypothetical protein
MTTDANDILEEVKPMRERVADYLRPAAEYFHEHEGKLFGRDEALDNLEEELDVDEELAANVLSALVSDTVDPVVQVPDNFDRYVGVIDYYEFDGAYGYVEYDDVLGQRRRVVCQQCVNEADFDSEVAHATENSQNPDSSTYKQDAGYDELLESVHQHYGQAHSVVPEDIETGASLADPTTIGGNTSFHTGNDGSNSGLDADSVDSQEPPFGKSTAEISAADSILPKFLG